MAKKNKKLDIKYQDKPVYPTQFDTNAFPNRVYIQGVKSLSILLVFLLMMVAALSIVYLHKIKSVSVMDMAFVYWDSVENTFKQKHIKKDYYKRQKRVPVYEILLDSFVDNYYVSRYGVSSDVVLNEKNWCECDDKSFNKKDDYLLDKNLVKNCFVCSYSSGKVYSSFINFHLPSLKQYFENKKEVRVVILNKEIVEKSIRTSGSSDVIRNFIKSIVSYLTGAKEKSNFSLSYTYKVDFALVNKEDRLDFSTEILTGYTSVSFAYDERFLNFKVVEHGEMTNAYDDVFRVKYKDKISRYLN